MVTSTWPRPDRPSTVHFIERQANFLRAAGVSLDVYHFGGRGLPWRYAAAWVGARRRLSAKPYDLIHAQFGQSGLVALPKRIPLVVTFRGSDLLGTVNDQTGRHTLAGRLLQHISRLVARQADGVIVVSEHMKRYLPPSVPALVLPSGIDLQLFRPMPQAEARRHLNLDPETTVVLFAGRPTQARKRHALALAAVEELRRRGTPAELKVAWGIPHREMPYHMNAADALLFTSMQEGSPNVVKEAIACNLPVVSVSVGDVAMRLDGIEGCEICLDERPESLAAALERVVVPRRRTSGRASVESLDERQQTERVIELYGSVLQKRPGNGRRP